MTAVLYKLCTLRALRFVCFLDLPLLLYLFRFFLSFKNRKFFKKIEKATTLLKSKVPVRRTHVRVDYIFLAHFYFFLCVVIDASVVLGT